MRKIQFIFILCVLSFLASCSKDDFGSTPINYAAVLENTLWSRSSSSDKDDPIQKTDTFEISFLKKDKGSLTQKTVTKTTVKGVASTTVIENQQDFVYSMSAKDRGALFFEDTKLQARNLIITSDSTLVLAYIDKDTTKTSAHVYSKVVQKDKK